MTFTVEASGSAGVQNHVEEKEGAARAALSRMF